MKKRMFFCSFIFAMSVFHFSVPNVIFGQSFAEQVFHKHRATVLDEKIQPFLPDVLRGFRKPEIQSAVDRPFIVVVLNNPGFITAVDPEVDYRFIGLLTINSELRALFRDEQFYNVLKDSDEIDKLVTLIEESGPAQPIQQPNSDCEPPQREQSKRMRLAIVSEPDQKSEPDKSLDLIVVVLDQYNAGLPGEVVTFVVPKGKGTFPESKEVLIKKTTNDIGIAKATLSLTNVEPNEKIKVVAFVIGGGEATLSEEFNVTAPGAASAPSIHAAVQKDISVEDVQGLLTQVKALPETTQADPVYQRDIAMLEQLLATLRQPQVVSKQTALLPNYPNPFNPETWIPYQLSEASEVTVSIYSVNGNLIRMLALGHQPAGIYQSKSRAVYWDGRNEYGERVASGLYFYTLTAGDFTATRKMLIRK
ncbi:MAG: T9SS type A sorting domain-containing protein [Candidatus Poribacteria bacterium]|nr:T9SS type A sorting domain-containing protein [Candidatus Poribacteria bacterium]